MELKGFDSLNKRDFENEAVIGEIREVFKENQILRELLWLNHGHTGQYGDDGEMQCGQCAQEYGFWDWKRTPAKEIQEKMQKASMKAFFGKTLL